MCEEYVTVLVLLSFFTVVFAGAGEKATLPKLRHHKLLNRNQQIKQLKCPGGTQIQSKQKEQKERNERTARRRSGRGQLTFTLHRLFLEFLLHHTH